MVNAIIVALILTFSNSIDWDGSTGRRFINCNCSKV